MSLVHKTLQKLNKQTKSSSVPPGMINLAPRKKSNKPSKGLLALLVVAVAGFAITMYLESNIRKFTVSPPAPERISKADKTQTEPAPVRTAPVVQAPEAKEADIQKRIEVAVQKALESADRNVMSRVTSTIKETVKRSLIADALPEPAKAKIVPAEEVEIEREPVARAEIQKRAKITKNEPKGMLAQVKNITDMQKGIAPASGGGDYAEADVPDRSGAPVLTKKQRAEFNRKISYNTTLALAERAYKRGDYPRAVSKYTEALEIKRTPASLANLSKALIAIGDVDGVMNLLNRYKEAVTDKVVATVALDMDTSGFDRDGLRLLAAHNGSLQNDSIAYYTAGQIHERHKRYLRAEAAYKKATDLLPSDSYYRYALARMLDTNGSYKNAVLIYKQIADTASDKTIKDHSESRAKVLEDYIKKLPE